MWLFFIKLNIYAWGVVLRNNHIYALIQHAVGKCYSWHFVISNNPGTVYTYPLHIMSYIQIFRSTGKYQVSVLWLLGPTGQLGIVLWYFCPGLSFICAPELSSFLSSSLCQPLFFVFCLQKHPFTWENLIYHWFGKNWTLALDCFLCQKLVRKSWTTMRKFNCILVLYSCFGRHISRSNN